MLKNFNHDDLEHFLKQSADQCRMQPSARVWNGISKKLNTRKRWFGFGLSALLLCSFSVFYLFTNIIHWPSSKQMATSHIAATPTNHKALKSANAGQQKSTPATAPLHFYNRIMIQNNGSPAFTESIKTNSRLLGDADNMPLSFNHPY